MASEMLQTSTKKFVSCSISKYCLKKATGIVNMERLRSSCGNETSAAATEHLTQSLIFESKDLRYTVPVTCTRRNYIVSDKVSN